MRIQIQTKKKGFTLLEILISVFVMSIVIAALLGSYLVIQRHWSGGGKQIRYQSQARNALNQICREIRGAKSVSVNGDELSVTRFDGDQTGFYYEASSEAIYHYRGADWLSAPEDKKRLIASFVIEQPGEQIFAIAGGKRVFVKFRIRDTISQDGYQGIDLQSVACRRN